MDNTGSGSGTCSTDGQQGEQVTITIDHINNYLLHKLKLLELDDAAEPKMQDTQQNTTKPRIQKIPPALFKKETTFVGHYQPNVVAFGPIHHGNPRLEKGEKVKLKLATHLDIDREAAFKEIMTNIKDLKDCYQEDVVGQYSERDLDLAFMFLIDGCAMLHFMKIVGDEDLLFLWTNGDEDLLDLCQEHHVNYDFIGFAKRDMFLLENQLPFKLLQLLTSSLLMPTRTFTKLALRHTHFLLSSCIEILPVRQRLLSEDPLHLLDLLHSNMTISVVGNTVGCLGLHHDKQHHNMQSTFFSAQNHNMQATFRSARELKSSGIILKQSATSWSNGVSFHQGFFTGTLRLPSITVNDSSTCMLLNLIAYEMCPDFKNELEVTSYVCFLDSLIDQSEDVRELRQARILRNHLSSDEDVAKLFNKMGSGLVPNPGRYKHVKREMYKQRKHMGIIRTWVAGVKEKYFSNPWTFLAVCGAVFGLVLTFIQAWYAVKSYYDNPKF